MIHRTRKHTRSIPAIMIRSIPVTTMRIPQKAPRTSWGIPAIPGTPLGIHPIPMTTIQISRTTSRCGPARGHPAADCPQFQSEQLPITHNPGILHDGLALQNPIHSSTQRPGPLLHATPALLTAG
jgi:hypothetical protein